MPRMGQDYIAAIDQGTTSSRCIVFDRTGAVVSLDQREHRQSYPRPGWVEHDAEEIWHNVETVTRGALDRAGLSRADLAAIGITNQRETTLLWDARTGEPVAGAIVWQDTRTDKLIAELAGDGGPDRFRDRSGLPLATYFSGPKVRWLLDHDPTLRQRAEDGEIRFGTIDSWLIMKLTGRHATDVTNASRTMLMNLSTLDWDDELLDALGVPRAMLPEILPSSHVYGEATSALAGVPVAGVLGDQQAALFGQTCFDPGQAKCTYGTGSFLLLNTGEKPVPSERGLLTTVGYRIGEEKPVYALEGSIAESGVQLAKLNVDGGMTASDLLMRFQADVLDVPVVRPTVAETTCLGAAYAAGLAVGFWPDLDTLRAKWEADARWEPAMPAADRDRAYHLWRKAVDRSFGWVD